MSWKENHEKLLIAKHREKKSREVANEVQFFGTNKRRRRK